MDMVIPPPLIHYPVPEMGPRWNWTPGSMEPLNSSGNPVGHWIRLQEKIQPLLEAAWLRCICTHCSPSFGFEEVFTIPITYDDGVTVMETFSNDYETGPGDPTSIYGCHVVGVRAKAWKDLGELGRAQFDAWHEMKLKEIDDQLYQAQRSPQITRRPFRKQRGEI